ncbi:MULTISPECIES: adenosylcobinamide-phosphate synthase CbiB [Thiorhodovibrio]|uniref:adenosylcobinamide-phosphate synthase CbiB n=1 Tax=Thiorhodovibrio TaxID=61593 RepID=UPI0019149885|nr:MULTISPECIES: adenosylcobinamide-phosphate synthase CbiB [Thiorhodovibrio]MBK5968730.1 cobalamin biosynthesis protein CobD [Thiorhodovibrio winogradskyi]
MNTFPWPLLLAVWLLDAALGDPDYPWHPIRLLGAFSLRLEHRLFDSGLKGYGGGALHWLLVIGAALAGWWLPHWLLAAVDPLLAMGWDLFLAYSLLCTRDLLDHGRRVLEQLHDLPRARRALSRLVGRDTEPLQTDGIVRATIESLAENLTDAVLTPFWALCLFGLPGLVLVKAISTLDSMVGYRNALYCRFGTLAARTDDLIHWLPARLSAPLIALAAAVLRLGGQPLHPKLALTTAWHQHALLPSPNSGWSEAACAGALRARLLGPIHRHGKLVSDLFMGAPQWRANLNASDLRCALALIACASWISLACGLAMAVLVACE